METSYGSAHIPDSLSIWKNGLPSFAGWFLTNDKPVITVNNAGDMEEVSRKLVRIGFNEVEGYLAGGMLKWHMAGKKSDSINT